MSIASDMAERHIDGGMTSLECQQAAEIERLRAENSDMRAALDSAEIAGGLTDNGNLWRFWAQKSSDILKRKEGQADADQT